MIEKILVGTTVYDQSSPTLDVAAKLAVTHDAELVVLRLAPEIDPREIFDPEGIPAPAGLGALIENYPGLRVRLTAASGNALRTVCDTAEAEQADWIVVGQGRARRRGALLSRRAGRALVQRAAGTVLLVAS